MPLFSRRLRTPMKSHFRLILWPLLAGVVIVAGFLCNWNRFAVALVFLFFAAVLARDIAYCAGRRDKK
jgi:hypothetical protein